MSSGSSLDTKRLNECLYYLEMYGSNAHMVQFYVRHGMLKKAALYVRDKVNYGKQFIV